MASTTMILNSSVMSAMKEEICFINRSTDASFPVCNISSAHTVKLTLSKVVMAYVAIDRLESVMRFSMSTLQAVTAAGWVIASLLSVLIAANLSTGLGDVKKSWRTIDQ